MDFYEVCGKICNYILLIFALVVIAGVSDYFLFQEKYRQQLSNVAIVLFFLYFSVLAVGFFKSIVDKFRN